MTVLYPTDLTEIGSHTFGCANQPIANYHEHEHPDDDIVLDSPSPLADTSTGGLFLVTQPAPTNTNALYSPTYTNASDFDDPYTSSHTPFTASPMLSSPPSSVGDEKPLGLFTDDFTWECKRGAIDPWTLLRSDSGPDECYERFSQLSSFLHHYRTQHELVSNERIVQRCRCCGCFAGHNDHCCTNCALIDCPTCQASWPLASWSYGTTTPPAPSLIPGMSTIRARPGFANGNGFLDPSSYFGGPSTYGSSPSGSNINGFAPFGNCGGSSYAGSTYSQTFASPASNLTAGTRRSERHAPMQHQVSSQHDALRHHHDEDSAPFDSMKEDHKHARPWRSERYAPIQHQVSSNRDALRHHDDEDMIFPNATKEDHSRERPFADHHYHHHNYLHPKKPLFTKSATPTALSLIVKSAKSFSFSEVNLKFLPCLALAHYLILLLLFFFPLGSSDTETTMSSSLIKEVLRSITQHMPLVSVLCIALGMLGMWMFRSGEDVIVDEVEPVDHMRGGLLPMSLVAY